MMAVPETSQVKEEGDGDIIRDDDSGRVSPETP